MILLDVYTNEISNIDYKGTLEQIERISSLNGHIKLKNESITGYYLLFKGLKENFNLDVNNLEFVFLNGKPFIKNFDVYFNISHSNGRVVCAFSKNEIGADIEKIRKFNISVAKKCFTDNEYKFINSNKSNQNLNFTLIWTLKEAFLKMLGTGVSKSALKSVEFVDSNGNIVCPQVCDITYERDGDFCVSVCIKKA